MDTTDILMFLEAYGYLIVIFILGVITSLFYQRYSLVKMVLTEINDITKALSNVTETLVVSLEDDEVSEEEYAMIVESVRKLVDQLDDLLSIVTNVPLDTVGSALKHLNK